MRVNHSSDHPSVFGVEIGLSRQNDRSPCSSRRRRRSQPPKPPRDAPRTPLKARGGASRAPRHDSRSRSRSRSASRRPCSKPPACTATESSSPEANPGFERRPSRVPGFYFPRRRGRRAAPRSAGRYARPGSRTRRPPRPPPAPPRGRPAQASLGAQAARSSPRAARGGSASPRRRA